MSETFPRKPLLDRIIVREIPLEEVYEGSELEISLADTRRNDRTDRGVVVAVGDCVPIGGVILPMPVQIGETVFFDEYALSDPVYLNPADKHKPGLPKYWQMRVGDLKGVEVK
jgi:co-chaperonin GroES (HSP10)